MPSVEGCVAVVEQALARYDAELNLLTKGAVPAASQLPKLKAWLLSLGINMPSITEDIVNAALENPGALTPLAYRALEIRQANGSASIKKLFSMVNMVCADGRLHDLFTFNGARTGRCTGSSVQPTNLPKAGPDVARCACGKHFGRSKPACPWCGSDLIRQSPVKWSPEVVDDVLSIMRAKSLDLAEMYFDEVLPSIAGCLRGLFVAGPGRDLVCSDYSAIEAVGLAELTGEQWRRDVFNTHGRIYEVTAARTTGVPFDPAVRHPHRALGKVQELALGYGGHIGSMVAFGAGAFMTEDEMGAAANKWRDDSPLVVEGWGGQARYNRHLRMWLPEMFGLEGAAVQAIQHPGIPFAYRGVRFLVRGSVLYCTLPSGRHMAYHQPRLDLDHERSARRGYQHWSISFMGWNTNPKSGAKGWVRIDTYGPKIMENVDQAACNDLLRDATVRAHAAGHPLVMHVYDELVAEVPHGAGSVEALEAAMIVKDDWCREWPVRAAGGWRGFRYRKAE